MNIEIDSRADLISAIKALRREDQTQWENTSVDSFLEALSAWIEDCDGYYSNNQIPLDPSQPSWQLFADALNAATVYE